MWQVVTLVLIIAIPYDNTLQKHDRPIVLRIFELQSTTEPTAAPVNLNTCIVVWPNGRAHLELRRQEMFTPPASLATYEYSLDDTAIGQLRSILDAESLNALPEWVEPNTPMNVSTWHSVTAEISRDTGVQRIGYFGWEGAGPSNAAQAQETWSRSKVAMEPLVRWFHTSKTLLRWKRVANSKTGVCGEELST